MRLKLSAEQKRIIASVPKDGAPVEVARRRVMALQAEGYRLPLMAGDIG